jgi:stearoyl-CoA 9-desaturase NADPH oxidoreductase
MSNTYLQSVRSFFNKSLFNTPSSRAYFEPVMEKWMPSFSLLGPMAVVHALSFERDDIIHIWLKPNFLWKGFLPGQHVSLGAELNGSRQYRSFSISSSPEIFKATGIIRLSIQRQVQGQLTNYLFENAKVGMRLHLSQAKGNFTISDNKAEKRLFIAGGVGITPVSSMLSGLNGDDKVLYYANRRKPHIIMEEAGNEHIMPVFTDEQGRFSIRHLEQFCTDFQEREVYICGPSSMEQHVRNILTTAGVAGENIHAESFSFQTSVFKVKGLVEEVRISLANSYHEFKAANNKSLLEILESKGLNPRFGCRMGICNECSCKKISGTVLNAKDNTLSHAGEEFIRICSSIPLGDLVLEY